jgi:hypothetical protein
MPAWAVECEDGRVFEAEATNAGEAVADVARRRNLRPSSLVARPMPKPERELAMPVLWGIGGALAVIVGVLLLV